MEKEKYVQDLSDIKQMMNRSSRFISLSGLAGVFAGGYAIIGAIVEKVLLDGHNSAIDSLSPASMDGEILTRLFLLAIAVLLLAIGTAVFLTTRKARKTNEKTWDNTSKRLLINFFAPLTSGGIFCLILWQYNLIGLIAPAMLIFYGLALIHASKYTFGDLRGLGYANLSAKMLLQVHD